jgi:acyl-CoA dehydrogenase
MILLAKTKSKNERNSKSDGLSLFLIDIRESLGSGMTIRPIETMINHSTTEVFFDNLEISHDSLIGKENEGFKQVLNSMNAERILIAAECIGDSNWFIQKAVDYAKDRKVFNKRIGENQGIQFPISRCYADTEAAKLAVYNAAARYDAGKACGTEANIAKLLAADASWNSANACLQTHGGFGFAKEYHIERKFRETRLYQVAPISTNFILSHIAEHKLGLPRSF